MEKIELIKNKLKQSIKANENFSFSINVDNLEIIKKTNKIKDIDIAIKKYSSFPIDIVCYDDDVEKETIRIEKEKEKHNISNNHRYTKNNNVGLGQIEQMQLNNSYQIEMLRSDLVMAEKDREIFQLKEREKELNEIIDIHEKDIEVYKRAEKNGNLAIGIGGMLSKAIVGAVQSNPALLNSPIFKALSGLGNEANNNNNNNNENNNVSDKYSAIVNEFSAYIRQFPDDEVIKIMTILAKIQENKQIINQIISQYGI